MISENYHATAVVVGAVGVLIRGPSGAGKSALALSVLAQAKDMGCFAILVSDDQVWLSEHSGRLVARAPDPIAGLIEVRGLGPVKIEHEPAAVIDLIVDLVAQPERYQEASEEMIAGVSLRRFDVSSADIAQATRVVLALVGEG
ncbi:HPr kinase/phosphorylase [Aquamicrobium zhengzhouense]|uniref:HPr kinase/phosphorylase n=1 Tax=Aquamicrobium zhengzhouense TaxID=2781738 RepID=A0ABS0SFU3_9HYPH|nr:HPr kinase/phosphorylase [Aquamicrobium zhengzhouense]MBI1622174.1 HPr kinase/phosphorylase [Aquamicrobium zhengzhouense]